MLKTFTRITAALAIFGALTFSTPVFASSPVKTTVTLDSLFPAFQPDRLDAAIATPTITQVLGNYSTAGAAYPQAALNANDIYYNGQVCKPQFAPIICLVANSPCQVVAAVAGEQTLVLEWHTVNSIATGTIYFATGSTAVTGTMTYGTSGVDGAPFSTFGHFATGTNAALNIYTTGTSNVTGGYVVYIQYAP